MLSLSVLDELQSNGWAKLDFASSDTHCSDLVTWATSLGLPISSRCGGSLVDILRVRSEAEASPWSLSARFGRGAFPFHTDQAKLRTPPRYIILRCRRLRASRRPTLIQDFNSLILSSSEHSILSRAVWIVNGGRGCFLTSILTKHQISGDFLLRFDLSCMKPAHSRFAEAANVLGEALSRTNPISIDWYEGLTIVLDNWRILHARANNETHHAQSGLNQGEEEREIERVLVLAGNN